MKLNKYLQQTHLEIKQNRKQGTLRVNYSSEVVAAIYTHNRHQGKKRFNKTEIAAKET